MSFTPRNTWFGSKTSSVPAHSGSEPVQHFYNPGHNNTSAQHQQPMWNNGTQPEAYWQGSSTSTPTPVSDPSDRIIQNVGGVNTWNWGSQTPYQVQYQQTSYQTPYHNNLDQNFHGNATSQSVLSSSNDPWNWGLDDSSSNDGVTNNNVEAVDPTWNWTVESQQPGTYAENSTNYQPQLNTFTESSTNTTYHQQPSTYTEPSTIYHQQPSTYTDGSSTYHHQPNTYTAPASCETLPMKNQLEEAFATKATTYDTNKSFQIEHKHSNEFFSKAAEVSNISTHENANKLEHNSVHTENKSIETTHLQASAPTTSLQLVDLNKAIASSASLNDETFSESGRIIPSGDTATSKEEIGNVSDPSIVSEDNQAGANLINSELSVTSVMHHNRQLLIADGLVLGDHQDTEFSVMSKHSSLGLTPQWSTESLPSQGSDEVAHTLEGSFMPSPLSPVSQSPCLPENHGFEHHFSNFTVMPSPMMDNGHPVENFSSGKLASSIEEEIFTSDKYLPTNSSLTVENVCKELHNLHVDVNRTKIEESGNSEIVPPESNLFHQPSGVETASPLPGPPKTTMTNVTGNPYAANKNKPTNVYRVSPLQSMGVDALSYPTPVMPAPHNEDPSPLYPNDAKTSPPTYGIVGMEPSSTADRTRVNVTGDQDVNLETPPDNKERPDVVELDKPLSPINTGRVNTPSVLQEPNTRQWGQQATYSVSPENQEIAPRCGPDRNQYLETGQLSDDEVSEVSQYRLREAGSWSGLQRMVPGQITGSESMLNQTDMQSSPRQTFNEDVSTPPPGLHRMVPGRTEQDNLASDAADDGLSQAAGGDVMLQRMVPGQMTDEDSSNVNTAPGEEIPPPGLRRMIPGESSSPESQVIGSSQPPQTFQPITAVPMEARVVTGVSREEVDGTDDQLASGATVATSASPAPDQPATNKAQPTSERSETIGSDNVETYPPAATDNTAREGSSSNRREKDIRHREEEPIDERESRRRGNHKSYRDRDREESPSGGRYEREGKRSHRTEREHHSRHGEGDRRQEERRRDRHDVDTYDKKRRDRVDRPKSSRERGRHDESPDARRYRDDHTRDRKRYDRDGYGNYHSNQEERRRYTRRNDYRDTDTGSEYSDYDRHGYDRRVQDRRDKPGYRGHDDYARYREDSRRYRDSRSHHDRKKLDSQDKSYRDSHEHRPDSREPVTTQFVPPIPAFPGIHGRSISEYMNYYNNLRTYDAAAYADWYNNVYKTMAYQQPVSYSEDRGSVHSGRSSANSGRYNRERELEQTTTSVTEDHPPMSPHRLTPSKYATAHVKATLTRKGQLIKVLPHYPLDGQPGIVEIHDIQGFFASDEVKRELSSFPGPLVKGITHKNSLIAFCNSKIKSAENSTDLFDRESVILLWKLLVLLLRQNGTVVGTDIAELLLNDHQVPLATKRPSAGSSPALHTSRENFSQEEQPVSNSNRSTFNIKSEEEITDTFREYLLYGNTKEALEWAMKNGLWGHALFLASKMDQRTYASIMTRFANGLTINDPLQTLYQLMSGRQPAAVTCCADEKWGDWRPHLAMILSNSSSQRVDLNYKSITTLGDTLGARGCLHAAHFTYLMAQVCFGTYAQKGSKIVLLGSSHHKAFEEFASNEAIQMTEIYEYSNRLADSNFTIVTLQPYKLLYARQLTEQGLVTEAMQYAEELSNIVLRHPEHYTSDFIKDIHELGDSLKYSDPFYNCAGEDVMTEDLPWLVKLKQLIGDFSYGNAHQIYPNYGSISNVSYTEGDGYQHGSASVDHLSQIQDPVQYDYNWQLQQQQPPYVQPYVDQTQEQWLEQQQQDQQQPTQQKDQQSNDLTEAHPQSADAIQNQPTEWPNTPQSVSQWEAQGHSTMIGESDQPYSNYWEQPPQHEELPTPQITLPNSVPEKTEKPQDLETRSKSPGKPAKKKEVPKHDAGNGWFGGLWNKLALRPKNQMKLPDDKNPTIVWDSERKRWTNLEGDRDDPVNDLPPPPKAPSLPTNSNLNTSQSQASAPNHVSGNHQQSNSLPSATANTGTNIYKMNRGRSLRSNYVDILGGNKTSSSQSLPPPPEIFPSIATQPQTMNFFVPGASEIIPEASSTDYNSSNTTADDMHGQNDNSVQGTEPSLGYGGPLMFNPSDFSQPVPLKTSKMNNHFKNRYPQNK